MKILIANGPNLNLVGTREPEIYGATSLTAHLESLRDAHRGDLDITLLTTNDEGTLIDALHHHGFEADGIVLNPGGWTHTSVALRDAVAAIRTPVLEVHLSNPQSREPFRHHSLVTPVAHGVIAGLGVMGYDLALAYFLKADRIKG